METSGAMEPPTRNETIRLWTGLLLPPLAWLIDLQISYAIAGWACANEKLWIIDVVSVATLAAVAAGGFISWGSWKAVDQQNDDAKRGRTKLMAIGGLANSAFFALIVIATAIPNFILRSCP